MRDVTGGENLITRWRMKELAHALSYCIDRIQLQMLHSLQNETRWQYATLPGSTMSYGQLKDTLYSKSTLTLLSYLANCPQYILEDGAIKRQGGLFPGFAQAFSALIVLQQAPTETRLHVLPIMQLCTLAHQQSAYAQLSPLYLLSTSM